MAAFAAGNIVVYRVGTGTETLSSAATSVFLDEYTAAGVLVQSIALPTADAGTMHAISASGTAGSEGLITDSGDGASLLLTGYDAAPGASAASVVGSTAANTPRIVGRVTANGAVDTGTVLTGFESGNNIRGVASADGSAIYASGPNGVAYTTLDSTATPSTLDTTNTRQIEVVNGQLYYSTGAGTQGIYTLGMGTPTTGTQTGLLLPGTGSNGTNPYAFFFAKLGADAIGNDTLYVADSGTGIEKFSLQNGTWTASGQIPFSGVTGLTGSVANGTVTLFATNPSSIATVTDATGQAGSIAGGTLKTVATVAKNEAFRGVALAPTGAVGTMPLPATTVSISDAAAIRGADGTTTETFSVTRSDTTGAFSFNYATADNSAKAGTDYTAEQGALSFAAGGPATQTIAVPVLRDTSAPTSENFTVNLTNLTSTAGSASFSKAAATGTIISNPTPIYAIQGSGFASPLNGQSVTTDGVVTAVASNGYYLQDAMGDGNTATSDGLFVFTSAAPGVAVGDLLATTGKVQEFTPSSAGTGAFSTTELSGITATNVVSHGNALPAAVLIGPDGRVQPTSDLAAGNALYESLEGMRVTVENPQAVGPANAFGEIETVAADGQGATGLNANGDLLISEGHPSFGNTDSQGGDFNPERIKIDSELVPGAVPAVNLGTQFTSTTGILNYAFNQFGVSATSPLVVSKGSTLTPTVGTLTGDATHLTFGSYNIENFTNSSGVAGQGPAKTSVVASQIVTNLKSPDIIALQEVQDNSGPTDDGTISGATNLQALTNAISAAGGPQYSAIDNPFIGNDTNGGQPGGNIRTAYLYNPARVTFVPGSLATVSANGTAIHDQGTAPADAMLNSDQQTNIQNPFYASRPPLSAQFLFNGQAVTVVDNHFTSKGGSGDLMGSTQPAFDGGEVQRAGQAQAINNYVDGLLASDPKAKIVVTGDLNEFNGEEPLDVLQGTASISGYAVGGASASTSASATYTAGGTQVLTDLESTLPTGQQYDYNFEGNAESLVHTLASNALAPGAQLQVIHINSEYANQTSDHDPLLTSFAIAPVCFAAGTRIATSRGEVPIEALRTGDLVATASGGLRPICWLGHRAVDCRCHPRPHEAMPVRIAAHAFAENRPANDLVVSPGHSIAVDLLGEVLIPASSLINGTTIRQENVERVTYWHVELESHEVILAEGLPCESYIEMGNRGFFAGGEVVALHASPDVRVATHADFCRPFHAVGPVVDFVRDRLVARALQLDWTQVENTFANLRLVVDGCRVEAEVQGLCARFLVPAMAETVWLESDTVVPAMAGGGADLRALGVCVGKIVIDDGFRSQVVMADDPRLGAGFHHVEEGPQRWTAGRARLPASLWTGCRDSFFLRVELTRPALPLWAAPIRSFKHVAA